MTPTHLEPEIPAELDDEVPIPTVPLFESEGFRLRPLNPGKLLDRAVTDPCDQRALLPSPIRADHTASLARHLFD